MELVSFNGTNIDEIKDNMKWKNSDERLAFLDGVWWMKNNPMPEVI